MFSVEFHNQFPDHKDDSRIDHCAQAETVPLEIGNKTAEQFDDHQKRQDVDSDYAEGLPDGPNSLIS